MTTLCHNTLMYVNFMDNYTLLFPAQRVIHEEKDDLRVSTTTSKYILKCLRPIRFETVSSALYPSDKYLSILQAI